MQVSILLATLFPDLAKTVIDKTLAGTEAAGIDAEIIVVSPHLIQHPSSRVRYLHEEKPSGNIAATNMAYDAATGDIVMNIVDDIDPVQDWVNLNLEFFRQREKDGFLVATSNYCWDPYPDGQKSGAIGTTYGLNYPCFPVFRKSVMHDKLGRYFDPVYKGSWPDCDLGMAVWAAGGRCEVSLKARFMFIRDQMRLPEGPAKANNYQKDMNTFVDRWKDKFGKGWGFGMRDFNLDMAESAVSEKTGWAIELNDPNKFFAFWMEHKIHQPQKISPNTFKAAIPDFGPGRHTQGSRAKRRQESQVAIGESFINAGKLVEASMLFHDVLKENPKSIPALHGLALASLRLGKMKESVGTFYRAMELITEKTQSYHLLVHAADAFHHVRNYGDAIMTANRAIRMNPKSSVAYCVRAIASLQYGDRAQARADFRRVLADNPSNAEMLNNYATISKDDGLIELAMRDFKRAMASKGDWPTLYENSLCTMYYMEVSDEERRAAHKKYEKKFSKPQKFIGSNDPDPNRKIKIGWFMCDTYTHPVARNCTPYLLERDRSQSHLTMYTDAIIEDDFTGTIRANTDAWVSTHNMSMEQVAAKIRADKIDVLVVLASHFDRNSPLIVTHRPAPVQINYHDPGSMYLTDGFDYMLGNIHLNPRDSEEQFPERIIRIPKYFQHVNLIELENNPKYPMQTNGFMTFGSFNNMAKLNDKVLDLWAEMVARYKDSRIILKYRDQLADPINRKRVFDAFARYEVDPSRIDMPCTVNSIRDHMELYNGVDIALDPFPFNGSTTTFEALYMGVPVITMKGRAMVGRWSQMLVKSVGLDEFVVNNRDEYMTRAAEVDLKKYPRDYTRAKAYMQFCSHDGSYVDRAIRATWRRWCKQRVAGSADPTRQGTIA